MPEILKVIKTLPGWDIEHCHLLVTSRKEQQIVESMSTMLPMEFDLSQMPVYNDIKMYIDFMLQSSSELKEWHPIERDLIRNVLLEKANRM